jgi:transposase-like protein
MFKTFKTLPELVAAFPTEQSAIDHFTAIRWANGKFCPLCGNADGTRIGTLTGTNTHKCYVCRKRFSIRVGTIFQDTKLPLRTWFAAVWLLRNHPKGIASTTLATDLGVTQKTAWFMAHRLHYVQRTKSFNAPLAGSVEVDETYIGGRARNRHKGAADRPGVGDKTAVVGVVERKSGKFAAEVVAKVDIPTMTAFVRRNVSALASLVATDDHRAYQYLSRTYRHRVVRHSKGEYVLGATHTNTIEGRWSLLKRKIFGIHHWVSPKHLHRYVAEVAWTLNRTDMAKGDAVNDMLAHTEGLLPYKVLIA